MQEFIVQEDRQWKVVMQEKCQRKEILQHHQQSYKFHYNSPIGLGLAL
jgi:hypothetical protein